MTKRLPVAFLSLAALGLLGALPALAQQRPATPPAAPQAAAPQAPERTVSQYGDWSLTCVQLTGQPRRCEVGLQVQDQQRRIGAAIAFGRISKEAPMRMVVVVPPNIRVSAPLRLVLEANETTNLTYAACTANNCVAELEMRDEVLIRRLRNRAAESPGRLEWKDAGGNDLTLPLSVRGFAAAMDALAREPG
jgi:invasion protein IalB